MKQSILDHLPAKGKIIHVGPGGDPASEPQSALDHEGFYFLGMIFGKSTYLCVPSEKSHAKFLLIGCIVKTA